MFWTTKASRFADNFMRVMTLFRVVTQGITVVDFKVYCDLNKVKVGNLDNHKFGRYQENPFPECPFFPQVSLTFSTYENHFVDQLAITGFEELRGLTVQLHKGGDTAVILDNIGASSVATTGPVGPTFLAVRTASRLLKKAKTVDVQEAPLLGWFFCDFNL